MVGSVFEGRGVRIGAIVLSLLLHSLLFASYGGAPSTENQQLKQAVTRLSFLAPAVTPAITPEALPEPEPEKPRVEPKPEPKQETTTKPARKKMTKPVKEEVKQVSQPVAAPSVAADAAPQLNEGVIKRETERYLTEVMAHIEKHKWYPKAARRRGIEGMVKVSFVLGGDGTARQLVVTEGPTLLMAAARKAVEKATPMPAPPVSVDCPLECEFRMRFSLNAS